MPAEPQDRPIHISKELREAMFAAARKNKLFAISCDDGGKNIAFQGTKTLEYEGPEGKGSCVYNWSKNAQISKLTEQFEAVAATLDEGSKLQRQYEHGRLSLDSEMELLEQMVHDGRAIEVENIAPHPANAGRGRGGLTAGAAAGAGSAAGRKNGLMTNSDASVQWTSETYCPKCC